MVCSASVNMPAGVTVPSLSASVNVLSLSSASQFMHQGAVAGGREPPASVMAGVLAGVGAGAGPYSTDVSRRLGLGYRPTHLEELLGHGGLSTHEGVGACFAQLGLGPAPWAKR